MRSVLRSLLRLRLRVAVLLRLLRERVVDGLLPLGGGLLRLPLLCRLHHAGGVLVRSRLEPVARACLHIEFLLSFGVAARESDGEQPDEAYD